METLTMKTTTLLIGSVLMFAACESENTPPPTSAEKSAAASAQADKNKAQTAKTEADEVLADAKKKAEQADDELDAASEKLDAANEKLGADWKGPARDPWHKSWPGFADGKEKTIDVDGWTIERGPDGELTAWNKLKSNSTDVGEKLTDAAVLAAVKTKLTLDADIKSRNIDVDVKDSVVTLKGSVGSAAQAGEATRIALGTSGVNKVVSRLTWNGRKM
jgi:hypothetical protein